MFKQKWLWGIVVLLLIVSIPGLVSRWDVESSSENYEIIIPYEEMALIEENSNQTIDDILSTLKDAGLTTVNLSPISLKDLEDQSYIRIYNEKELAERLLYTPYQDSISLSKKGYYISVPEAKEHRKLIEDSLPIELISFGDLEYYFISHTEILFPLQTTKIGYDNLAIEKIREHGLLITLKIANSKEPTVNDHIVRQLVDMKTDDITGLVVYGQEMIGFEHENKGDWYRPLHDAGYYFYNIEGHTVKDEHRFAKFSDYNVVRLISFNPIKSKDSVAVTVDKSIRAVKERNIRAIFYHIELTREELARMPFEKFGSAEVNIENAQDFITGVQEKMPDRFTLGAPKLFDEVNVPSWVTVLVLLAGMLFTWIVSSLVKNKYLRIGSVAVMALLAVAYFVLNRVLFLQAFALMIAVITPIYAVVASSNGSKRILDILVQYVKALAISMVGIWIIVGLLNGNGFITGFEQFRGVKLVYIIPIVGVFLYSLSFFVHREQEASGGFLSLLNKEVKYGHVFVAAILAAAAYFYISRTGNAGTASTLELAFRQWLEDILYVRPRTKEFLIGFPFFVLAMYVMGINRKWGSILLIPGVIGLLSIVNTFTHFHIPLEVSLLRTLYGAVIGFVVGLVFIGIYNLIVKNVRKFVKVK